MRGLEDGMSDDYPRDTVVGRLARCALMTGRVSARDREPPTMTTTAAYRTFSPTADAFDAADTRRRVKAILVGSMGTMANFGHQPTLAMVPIQFSTSILNSIVGAAVGAWFLACFAALAVERA